MRKLLSKNDFLIDTVFRQILIVMIIAELSTSVATMLDGIIIAHFFSENAIASYGLTIPYSQMLKMVGAFFATGTQVVFSKYAARGEIEKANEVFSVSVIVMAVGSCALAASILLFSDEIALALGASVDAANLQFHTSEYLRGLAFGLPLNLAVLLLVPLMNTDNDRKRVAVAINVMLIVNLLGDLLVAVLMNGNMFALALVTSISHLCSLVVLLLHFRKKSSIRLRIRGNHPGVFSEVAQSGIIPTVTRSFSMIRAYFINILFLSAGTSILAANTLVQGNIKAVPICVATAIGMTTLAISGVLYDEHDKRGLCQLLHTITRISFGHCLLITVLVFVFAPQIVALFGAHEIEKLTVLALRCFIIGLPFISVKMFFVYYFQSTRKKMLSYYSSFFGELFFLLFSAYTLGHAFGVVGLFLSYPVSEIIYLASIVCIAWVKGRRFPRHAEDFLFLGKEYDVEESKTIDASISTIDEAMDLSKRIMDFCLDNGFDRKKALYVRLAFDEMASNILEHGVEDGKTPYVDVKLVALGDSTLLRLRDNCKQFNPNEIAEMLSDDPTHNIGIRIVSRTSEHMQYVNLFELNQLNIRI